MGLVREWRAVRDLERFMYPAIRKLVSFQLATNN